jgi:uncharacterized repeat protein (TIGR02543 family)
MMRLLKPIFIVILTFSTIFVGLQPAQAIDYTITYNANETQHQTGVTTGSVPSPTSYASGTVVTVSANTGNLTRQGFTFAGWNTAADGTGTTYAAGSGTLTLTTNRTLYAKWEIPAAARLIGAGGTIGSLTNTGNIANGSYCTGSHTRGITSDGTYLYIRPASYPSYICKLTMAGNLVELSPVISTLGSLSAEQLALTYSKGCIFIRDRGDAGTTKIYCIDVSDWSMTERTLPNAFYAGTFWLYGNLIDFPDGRVGAVSAPNTAVSSPGTGTCPVGMYCKVLRLFNVSGTGKAVTFTFSEDILLADSVNSWPSDDHGIATDGTYLFQIRFDSGYKVWALRSGAPSYLVFNADGTGSCGAGAGVTGTVCSIKYPVTSLAAGGALANATYIGRNHVTGNYFIGDHDGFQFYKTASSFPPAGPGSLIASFNSLALPSNATTASYRTPVVISVSVSVASKVTFKAGNVVITGCKNKTASGSGSTFTATCSWRPSVRGTVPLFVVATPTGPAYGSATSSPLNVFVGKRTGNR